MYNGKYLKTKRKPYNGKTNTNFYNNKIPKEGFQFICLSVILIDSVFKTGKNCFSQIFLEERKYIVKEKRMPEYVTDDIKISSDSDKEDSDEENPDEKNCNRENLNEENEVTNVDIKKYKMQKITAESLKKDS